MSHWRTEQSWRKALRSIAVTAARFCPISARSMPLLLIRPMLLGTASGTGL